jgi:hypothetical protein
LNFPPKKLIRLVVRGMAARRDEVLLCACTFIFLIRDDGDKAIIKFASAVFTFAHCHSSNSSFCRNACKVIYARITYILCAKHKVKSVYNKHYIQFFNFSCIGRAPGAPILRSKITFSSQTAQSRRTYRGTKQDVSMKESQNSLYCTYGDILIFIIYKVRAAWDRYKHMHDSKACKSLRRKALIVSVLDAMQIRKGYQTEGWRAPMYSNSFYL